jgi:hypothetical protein
MFTKNKKIYLGRSYDEICKTEFSPVAHEILLLVALTVSYSIKLYLFEPGWRDLVYSYI